MNGALPRMNLGSTSYWSDGEIAFMYRADKGAPGTYVPWGSDGAVATDATSKNKSRCRLARIGLTRIRRMFVIKGEHFFV